MEREEAQAQTQLMREGCCCEGQSCVNCLREPPELDEPPPRGDGWHSQRSSDMGWQVEPEEAHNASGHAPGMHGLVGSPRSRAVQSPAAHIMHCEPILIVTRVATHSLGPWGIHVGEWQPHHGGRHNHHAISLQPNCTVLG